MDARQKPDHSPTFLRHYTYDPPPPKSTGRRRVTRVLLWSTALIGLPLGLLAMSWLIMLPDVDVLGRNKRVVLHDSGYGCHSRVSLLTFVMRSWQQKMRRSFPMRDSTGKE